MTLDIDLPDFAPALMNLADFLYARQRHYHLWPALTQSKKNKKLKCLWYFLISSKLKN